jgi:radical SAM/Cys-rich protein
MPVLPTLNRRSDPLANARRQCEVLAATDQPSLESVLARHGLTPLCASGIEVLQINVGKVCNQTCAHCHVDAGPERAEVMTQETMQACLRAVESAQIPTVDLTGGAPELNPHFRWLVAEARRLGAHVIDRCNLTIMLAAGFTDLPEFLAEHQVEIVASLPCYTAENVDRQRGEGVYVRSVETIRVLNRLGYGRPGTGLELSLVFNPLGPSLPPPQAALEVDYRRELAERHGLVFNRLYTITNMPISRFLDDLIQAGRLEEYLDRLVAAFNPRAVEGLMCRTMISVGWDGALYDCDFNQMLEIGLTQPQPRSIFNFDAAALARRPIATFMHCFGCTAGSGSSCQGTLVNHTRGNDSSERK